MTTRTGKGNVAGSSRKMASTAAGPPVEAPMATTLGCRWLASAAEIRVRPPERASGLSRARGWVITLIREISLTVAMKFAFPLLRRGTGRRLLQHVQRAGGQRFVGLEQLAAVGGGRHDQNGRGAVRHHVFGDRHAGHERHHHVQRHHIRAERLAQLDGALAIRRLRPPPPGRGRAASTSTSRLRTVNESSTTRTRIFFISPYQPANRLQQLCLIELAFHHVGPRAGFFAALFILR